MYSYSEFTTDIKDLKSLVDDYKGSTERVRMITAKRYYDGDNVEINNVIKSICIERDGLYRDVPNPFVSNFHIADKFTEDMVNQKVYTLLDKSPQIEDVEEKTQKVLRNTLDYCLQQMGVECSLCGVSYAFVEYGKRLNFKVFESENCIGFFNEIDMELMAMVRFWDSIVDSEGKNDKKETSEIQFIEIYEKDLYTLYKIQDDRAELIESHAYLIDVVGNSISTTEVGRNWTSGFPVVCMRNNKYFKADFDKAIKSQIDSIDIVRSDFANNLGDFQDVFWTIKGLDGVTAEEVGSFMETLKNTKKAVFPENTDVDVHQIAIPYEARKEFIEMTKKQLISNGGILDTEIILSGGLTATAINVASKKLMLRVSKFEYEVYVTALRLIEFAKEFTSDTSSNEPLIRFIKSVLSNDTETITNLTMSLGQISQETYLENHPYVEDVKRELERLADESTSKFTLNEVQQ